MTFPRSSELPWFGFGTLVVAAVSIHLLGGFIDWLARPSARSPAPISVAATPASTTPIPVPLPRAPSVAAPVAAPIARAPVVASPMVTASSGWLPHDVSIARLQGWLAFQQRGGRMPPELAQRLAIATQLAERVQRGQSLTQSQESDLARRGAQVLRLRDDVTVRFTPDALPIPPTNR